jgi:hypothetical protein
MYTWGYFLLFQNTHDSHYYIFFTCLSYFLTFFPLQTSDMELYGAYL